MVVCQQCSRNNQEVHFYAHAESKSGMYPWCAPCHGLVNKRNYLRRKLRQRRRLLSAA